ncbi:retron Eco8 family effector endonuclease [Proteus genomosp. 6]|uniref:Retron Eco8 family effector endonuclease n=1 Tax=Proteus genomosp. 6 TaxID=1311820 RepID=A0ABV1LB05_9GAMM
MTIKSIKIKNLLSYNEIYISRIEDINCVIGRNNTGKSNLLKLIKYFYYKLEKKDAPPPKLNNNYSSFGEISIEYDVTRISKIVNGYKNGNNKFFKQISNSLLKQTYYERLQYFLTESNDSKTFTLTLKINSDNSIKWSTKDTKTLNIINHLYPYFELETRHVDLYDWNKLWQLISKLKSFNVEKISSEEIIEFFDSKIGENSNSYSDYINKIKEITKTTKYRYKEKVLNFVKVGLDGQTFEIDGKKLESQSDGTNSFKYIEIFLSLLISLTRRDYITPIVFIDEAEIGLHPKKSELLIENLYEIYTSFKKTKKTYEQNKYATPYPNIFISTHSPNILKSIVKLFDSNQQVLHFSIKNECTHIRRMNSIYNDSRFLNIFNDNEARLFFSEFILFVEGATEQELFSNKGLFEKFNFLKKIDVYAKSDDVALKYINPSFSNASIPYLVLYDADKLFDFDNKNKKMKLLKDKINIRELKEKYEYTLYGSENNKIKNSINLTIELLEKKIFSTDQYNIEITNFDWNKFISIINNSFLFKDNYWIASTTIEGCLISEHSLKLFKLWILDEIRRNLNPKINNHINRMIMSKINTSIQTTQELLKTCEYLLTRTNIKQNIGKNERLFIHKIKNKLINILDTELTSLFSNKKTQSIALRIIFCGKSETLLAKHNKNYNNIIDKNFIKNLNDFQSQFKILKYLHSKTSGWVTDFMNFSVNYIDENSEDQKDFYENFKLIFPELYEIINKLRFR